jgi:hypothetical protein
LKRRQIYAAFLNRGLMTGMRMQTNGPNLRSTRPRRDLDDSACGRPSDDAEQPQDQDEQQKAAETDIHDIPPYSFVAVQTVSSPSSFHSLRCGIERAGIILP